jgi:hypothetical protein
MILPLRAGPDDPAFLSLLNRRLQELGTSVEELQRSSSTGGARAVSGGTTISVSPAGYAGPHSRRLTMPAGSYDLGTLFWETDRLHWYGVVEDGGGRAWRVVGGELAGTIHSPDEKPSDLGADDAGFCFYASDFVRRYRWSGTAWERGAGEACTLQVATSPVAIAAAGWKTLDGTSNPVRYSLDDGTTATISLPDATGAYEVQGTWTGTVDAAVAPGLTGSTAAAGGHDHDVTLPDHTHAIDHDHPSASTGPPEAGGTATLQVGAGASVGYATTGHSHAFDPPAFTGSSGSDGADTVATDAVLDHSHGKGTLAVDSAARPPSLKVYRAVKL